jgi:uncharacterized protein
MPDQGAVAAGSQHDVVTFLLAPATHGGLDVERIDTHISTVFLAGDRALKLKRAVHYDYVDFSTPDLRRAACEAEVRLNRRTAPELYRGVVAVTRAPDGSLALDGTGTPCDWLVDMRRFDQALLLDRLAARGALDVDAAHSLGAAVAEFHAGARPRVDRGGHAGMAWVVAGNAAGFDGPGRGVLDEARARAVTARTRQALAHQAPLLEGRRARGMVRECHGDLHLRNIVLLDGRPTLFDAIEFNEAIACVDVLYDLAFLLMDLWRRHLPRHASEVLNSYVGHVHVDDLDGLALLPLFLSCRASVRAKTSATAALAQPDGPERRALEDTAREYLTLAGQLLEEAPPRLVAIGGLSGSGKSTVARALAPSLGSVPGALVLRSDTVRKALRGLDEQDRLGPDGYTPEMSAQVYATLRARARVALAAGRTVILDAVYARPEDRQAIEAVAMAAGVPFTGIWLDASAGVLERRVSSREGDASDADAQVVRQQVAADHGPMRWHRIDASAPPEVVVTAVGDALRV